MALTDYTYIVTLGQACTLNYQLARSAALHGVPAPACTGPFDWLFVNVGQVIKCVENDFADYFRYATTYPAKVQDPNDCWRMTDGYGITTAHQMMRDADETEPLPEAWFEFGKWIGRRLTSWEARARDARGNILFLRLEATWEEDDPNEIAKLVRLLGSKFSGSISFAWIRYAPQPEAPNFDEPCISIHHVRKTWPAHLREYEIEWMRDYGDGPAWRGHDGDWERVFDGL